MHRQAPRVLLAIAALSLAGCATYTETTKQVVADRRAGDTLATANLAASLAAQHKDDRDTVVYTLEAGAAYRSLGLNQLPPPPPPAAIAAAVPVGTAATSPAPAPSLGDDWRRQPYERSLYYFQIADDKIDEFDLGAKHKVSSGATMVVTNPGMVPYRGLVYDKIMLSTYSAFDYLALGEVEKARASFNKAYLRQQDAVAENEKRIEQEKEKIEAARSGKIADENGKQAGAAVDVSKSEQDPKLKAALDDISRSLDTRIQAYGDYVNPFTVFTDALFMMTCSTDQQERERSAKEFLRVASMVPDNPFLTQDAQLAEDLAAGKTQMPKTAYVIFESGEAPHREEMLIPVPIFLFTSNETIYTQLPLYRLSFNDRFNPSATISVGDKQVSTAVVCNMDSVIAHDYKNNLSTMWLDAFLCASTKAVLQHELNKQAQKQSSTAGLLMGLVGSVFNAATTRADTRSWTSLPKVFSYARVTPSDDGNLTITTPDSVSKTVKLPDANVSVVYVKQVQPGAPLLVDTFKLL